MSIKKELKIKRKKDREFKKTLFKSTDIISIVSNIVKNEHLLNDYRDVFLNYGDVLRYTKKFTSYCMHLSFSKSRSIKVGGYHLSYRKYDTFSICILSKGKHPIFSFTSRYSDIKVLEYNSKMVKDLILFQKAYYKQRMDKVISRGLGSMTQNTLINRGF